MKICVQTAGIPYDFGVKEGYKMIREAGFEGVDWNIDMQLRNGNIERNDCAGNVFEKPLDEMLAYYAADLEAIRENGLTITQAHAPFSFYNNKPGNAPREYMSMIYQNVIRLCDAVGCRNVVIHGASRARTDEHTAEEIAEINKWMYESLIPVLKETNVTVCLENLPIARGGVLGGHCCNPYDAIREIDELNEKAGKECFGLCLDVGHLNLVGLDPRTYIRTLGKRIKALHIHDNDGVSDQHKAPYTGTIVWRHLYEALAEIDYEGDLAFETFRQTDVNVIGDKEMTMPWLRMIAQIGKFFRIKIKELQA